MRHVRVDEARCPFCAAALAAHATRELRTGGRSRALQFAVAATLLGCKEDKLPEPAAPHVDKPAAVIDTGTAVADTYVEPLDASSASAPDVSTEQPHPRPKVTATVTAKPPPPPPNLKKPYGAPPVDGLLV